MKKAVIVLSIIFCCLPNYNNHAENFEFNDLYSFPQVSNPRFSPDGNRIVFELKTYNLSSDSDKINIWIMNSDGSEMKPLTTGEFEDANPQWLDDNNSIIFESDREDGNQIWLLGIDQDSLIRLTSLYMEINSCLASPTDQQILFASDCYPGCLTDSCNRYRYQNEENNPVKAKLYENLMFRHYKYWTDDAISQLFIYDIPSDTFYQLTFESSDIPTSILGGDFDYACAPDGREICLVMNQDSIPAIGTNNDLFLVPSTGGDLVKITDNNGQDHTPLYSPDGKYIAYLSQARAGYESDQNDLIIYDRKTGNRSILTDMFDRSINNFLWGPDSKYIYFQAIEYGLSKLWRIDIETMKIEVILENAVYDEFDLSPDGNFIVASASLSNQPEELYLYDIGGRNLKRLTFFTKKMTDRVSMQISKPFWFEGFNGDSVQGFITLPPDFDSTRKYPLAFLIHGGPQWCWLEDFNYYGWNTQLTAAQDYVVVQINPHGSLGYGIKFKEYVSGNWGKGDFDDLMLGLDYVLEKYPFIDSTNMAALGRSYGGFMINWINGHTDRFKCMISIDGAFNQISEYGTTDELWFPEWEAKGTPWINHEEYVRSSPMTYSANFKTPTMFIHGQKDYRVDVSEGLQAFTTLRRMGIPSQLLYFPDEGHSLKKLYNIRYVYEKQFEWLARWLK